MSIVTIAEQFPKGTVVFSRNGEEKGIATGNVRWFEGFEPGDRPEIRWPDGRRTYPHPSGIMFDRLLKELRIH